MSAPIVPQEPIDFDPGYIDVTKNPAHLFCQNEKHGFAMELIFNNLEDETLMNLTWPDNHIRYKKCPKCGRGIIWPIEPILNRLKK